ncbi:hypothetical protein ACWEKJ_20530 [Amycolatopsis thermoflava]|uniref:hypothetical protein n=1 Tax=Amycolatopsis thermoflava TaxID=84480 RepID=UPI003EBD1672
MPTGTEAVTGGVYDFSSGRAIGDLEIDYAFTELARDEAGLAWVRLDGNDGATSELWVDESCPYVELFTGDSLGPGRRRTGLGVEPMTRPPDAFRSGDHVVRLAPGDRGDDAMGRQVDMTGPGEQDDLEMLRLEAERKGLRGVSRMDVDQLRRALAERRRGLDPKQAEEQATGEEH